MVTAWPHLSLDPNDWFNAVVKSLATAAEKGLDSLWSLLAHTALATPDVTGLRQVRDLDAGSLAVVNCCYVLVILAAAVMVTARGTVEVRYGIGELAPRIVVGLVAANMSRPIVATLIGLSNALTQALTGDGISPTGTFDQLHTTVSQALTNGTDLLLTLILCVTLAGLTATLMLGWLVRIGVLVALTGLAPVALACHGLPGLDGVARLWWRSVAATLLTVLVQAVLLHATLRIFLDPTANRRALGLDHANSSSLNLLVVVALMWATVKVPTILARYVTRGSGGRNVAAGLLRVVFVQQLTRSLAALTRRHGGVSARHPSAGSGLRPAHAVAPPARRPAPAPAAPPRAPAPGRSARPWPAGPGATPPSHP